MSPVTTRTSPRLKTASEDGPAKVRRAHAAAPASSPVARSPSLPGFRAGRARATGAEAGKGRGTRDGRARGSRRVRAAYLGGAVFGGGLEARAGAGRDGGHVGGGVWRLRARSACGGVAASASLALEFKTPREPLRTTLKPRTVGNREKLPNRTADSLSRESAGFYDPTSIASRELELELIKTSFFSGRRPRFRRPPRRRARSPAPPA